MACGRQVANVLALVAAALGPLAAQSGFDALPQRGGRALDPQGQPIAGAEVSIEALDRTGQDLLERQPIPPLRTARDGSFVLPLAPSHLCFRSGDSLALRIAAPGCQTWREPLPFGLAGFVGTVATLRAWRDDERYDVQVRAPRPGDLLWLRRIDSDDDPLHRHGELLEVPASGQLALFAAALPCPLVNAGWRQARAVGHELSLLSPGRSETVKLDPTRRRITLGALAAAEPDKTWPAQTRVLCELPNGARRWFPLAVALRSEPRPDPLLRLLAAQAPGCAATLSGGDHLPPPPQPLPAAGVRLALPADAPGLRAFSLDLEAWFARREGGRRRGWRELQVGAELVLDAAQLYDRALWVEAEGHAPRVYGPGELAAAPLQLAREPAGELRVRVRAADGAPATAELRLPDQALLRAPLRAVRTDATGVARFTELRPGQHRVEALGEFGYAAATASITPGQTSELTLLLESRTLRAILRQPNGDRAAFAGVVIDELSDDGVRSRRYACADALGRVLVSHAGPEFTLHCGAQRFADLDLGERAAPHDLDVAVQRHALVQLPRDARVLAALFTDDAGRIRSQRLDVTASAMWLTWPDDAARCDLLLGAGPPASVRRAELTAGATALARDALSSRARVDVVCDDGQPTAELRAHVPKSNGALVVVDAQEGDSLVRDGAALWLARRDPGAARVQLLAPDYLPSAIITLAEGEPTAPLRVELRRGARVTLRFLPGAAPPPGRPIELTIVDGEQPRYQVTLATPPHDATRALALTLPFGLPAGDFGLELGYAQRQLRLPCSVTGTSACEVEIGR